jgi:glutaredoxin
VTVAELTVTLYSSSFCGACASTRAALENIAPLLGERVEWREVNVAADPEGSERANITSTPTVVITGAEGDERMRAAGVPTTPQLLTAIAAALP